MKRFLFLLAVLLVFSTDINSQVIRVTSVDRRVECNTWLNGQFNRPNPRSDSSFGPWEAEVGSSQRFWIFRAFGSAYQRSTIDAGQIECTARTFADLFFVGRNNFANVFSTSIQRVRFTVEGDSVAVMIAWWLWSEGWIADGFQSTMYYRGRVVLENGGFDRTVDPQNDNSEGVAFRVLPAGSYTFIVESLITETSRRIRENRVCDAWGQLTSPDAIIIDDIQQHSIP